MSLIEEALTNQPHPGPVCYVQRTLSERPDMADDIAALIRARQVTNAQASTTLAKHGVTLSDHTIGRHRLNRCTTCRMAGVTW